MKLISTTPQTQTVTTGRLSDGSDRQIVTTTTWTLTVLDDDGIQRTLSFGHNPTAAEVYAAVTAATALTPVTKADWARAMKADYDVWWRWKQTRLEAQSRSMAAAIVTALTAQENAAWTTYAADVTAWNSAT